LWPLRARRRCVAECRRVLRSGGIFITSSHNPRALVLPLRDPSRHTRLGGLFARGGKALVRAAEMVRRKPFCAGARDRRLHPRRDVGFRLSGSAVGLAGSRLAVVRALVLLRRASVILSSRSRARRPSRASADTPWPGFFQCSFGSTVKPFGRGKRLRR
jgi:hypothetical protein